MLQKDAGSGWRHPQKYFTCFLCAHISRKCFKGFLDGLSQRFVQNGRCARIEAGHYVVCDRLPKICKIFNRCIFSFGGWQYFCFILLSRFCGLRDSYLPKYMLSEVSKLCSSEAIGLRLVETDTRHCLGYLAGTDFIKLS